MGKASESWTPIEAQVTRFKVKSTKSHSHNSRSTAYVELAYEYQFDGVDYTGDRAAFGHAVPGQVERPKRGGTAVIHVNPENPSESVYNNGVSPNNLGGLAFGVGLMLGGLLFLFLSLKLLFWPALKTSDVREDSNFQVA